MISRSFLKTFFVLFVWWVLFDLFSVEENSNKWCSCSWEDVFSSGLVQEAGICAGIVALGVAVAKYMYVPFGRSRTQPSSMAPTVASRHAIAPRRANSHPITCSRRPVFHRPAQTGLNQLSDMVLSQEQDGSDIMRIVNPSDGREYEVDFGMNMCRLGLRAMIVYGELAEFVLMDKLYQYKQGSA